MKRFHQIFDRIKSGLKNAKSNGKVIGRPKGKTKKNQHYLKEYKKLNNDLDKGISLRKLSIIHNLSVNTIRKVKGLVSQCTYQ